MYLRNLARFLFVPQFKVAAPGQVKNCLVLHILHLSDNAIQSFSQNNAQKEKKNAKFINF